MLPDHLLNPPKTRNPLLNRLLQAATKASVGCRAALRGFIASRISRNNQCEIQTTTGEAINAMVQPLYSQLDPMDEFGFISVKEPFVFTVNDEHISVAVGAGGAVIAKIAIETQAQAEELILCLEAILHFIEARDEPCAAVANAVFLGAGVFVEVRRSAVAVRVRLLASNARTPKEVTEVVAALNQVLKKVTVKGLARQHDQPSDPNGQPRTS